MLFWGVRDKIQAKNRCKPYPASLSAGLKPLNTKNALFVTQNTLKRTAIKIINSNTNVLIATVNF